MAYIFFCPFCDFTSRQEPRFFDHLLNQHNVEPLQAYLASKELETSPECLCGCGEIAPWKGWKAGFSKFVRGHNAKVYSSFSDPETIERMKDSRERSRKAGFWKVWNSGLTKETSESLASSAIAKSKTLKDKYASGKIIPWQLGLTKETSNSIEKMSETKRKRFESGEIKSWNSGLTKESSESIARASMKISESYERREAGKRLSLDEVTLRASKLGFSIINDGYKSRKGWGLTVVHEKCGTQQVRSLYSLETGLCVKCDNMTSTGQREIEEFIRSLSLEFSCSSRSIIPPQEIDIWIPSHRLGIEFNGLYWHSENFKEKGYHDQKSNAVRELGGSLLHVFEDEWRSKRTIVESMIRSRLGLSKFKLGARNCVIRELLDAERQKFFEASHIDGDVRANAAWGLIHDNKIVSALSIRKPFHTSLRSSFEISRFASLPNYNISGALSRLMSRAIEFSREQGAESIVTYVDLRHGTGKSYETVGFKLERKTTPRFWWTDFTSRQDRFSIKANSSIGLSEREAAKNAGFVKIWGCSNYFLRFSMKECLK